MKSPKLLVLTLLLIAVIAFPSCSVARPETAVLAEAPGAVLQSADDSLLNLNSSDDGDNKWPANANFLVYGYHVLKYGYIDSANINKRYPILDEAKLTDTDQDTTDSPHSDGFIMMSKKVSDFSSSLRLTSDVKVKRVLFSGSISAEYNLDSHLTETQMLIRYMQYHTVSEHYLTCGDGRIKELLSDSFKADLVTFKNKPSEIFKRYGTHLFTQYYLGGRAELNFKYNNSSSKTESEIRSSVTAAYSGVSGSASADDKKKASIVTENSDMSFRSIGGNNISGASIAEIASQYKDWIASLKQSPDICKIAEFEQAMIPIWELVDDPETAKALQDQFDKDVLTAAKTLEGFDYVPPAKPFIVDIMVVTDSSADKASKKIPDGYIGVKLNPGTTLDDLVDCNAGAGGDFVYICYKLGTDKSKAIAGIGIATGKKTKMSGYTKIDVDLNRGAGGDFIYLFYRRAKSSDKHYLADIRGYYGKGYSLPSGWHSPANNTDLNKGAGGKFIYLAYTTN